MRKVKTYEDYCNEEINWRKAAIGTALAGSLLGGITSCEPSKAEKEKIERIAMNKRLDSLQSVDAKKELDSLVAKNNRLGIDIEKAMSDHDKYKVKKVSGTHKYGGVTKLEYETLNQLIDKCKETSEKEMWKPEKTKLLIEAYKTTNPGGKLILYVQRSTSGSANLDMYSVIIKDSSGTEVYRTDLDREHPNYSSYDDAYWNYGYVYIPTYVKSPFTVYVVDRLEDAPFKFEVSKK